MYILRNCRFVPELTEGYTEMFGDILVDGSLIAAVEPEGYTFGAGIKEYDMHHKTVMPGMFDIHTHVNETGKGNYNDVNRDEYQTALDTLKNVQDCLYAGFTTLRDAGGEPYVCLRVKQAIESGKVDGPNLIVCGRLMSPTEPGNHSNNFVRKTIHEVDAVSDIRRAVREEIRDGADYIKYVVSGAISLPGSVPGAPICTYEEIEAVVKEAAFKGRYVGAHAHDAESVKMCLKAGVKTIEHASELDEECIEILKRRESYIVPTLSNAGMKSEAAKDLPEYARFMAGKGSEFYQKSVESMKRAYEAGLIMGLGTDQGMPNLFHGKNAKELVYRKQMTGLPEVELLKHATINSAIIVGLADKLGSIKVGKVADIIAVDGDPVQDIHCLTDRIAMVIKSGKMVKNTDW